MSNRLMWCDDFDMDLLKVIPDIVQLVDQFAFIRLWTYCEGTTHGSINLPTCWNTREGIESFFWSEKPEHARDEHGWVCFGGGFMTKAPLVECTFLELLRDKWCHQSVVNLDGKVIWRPGELRGQFDLLMYHLRGWKTASDAEVAEAIARVKRSIEKGPIAGIVECFDEHLRRVDEEKRRLS